LTLHRATILRDFSYDKYSNKIGGLNMRPFLILLALLLTLTFASSAVLALTVQTVKGTQLELDEFNYLIKNGTIFVPIQTLISLFPYEVLPGKELSWNTEQKIYRCRTYAPYLI
jgi:hypothetical protein